MRVDKSKWEKSSIVDSCDIQLGTRIVKKQAEEGCFSVYGGGGATFTTNTYNRENAILISRFALSKECTRFISGKFYLNDSGLTLVPKNESLDFDFLKWQIFSLNDKIYELARGAAQKNLDMKRFPLLSILVPTLSEQQAIVSELDAIQKMIDGYKAQIADLDTLVQSIFLDMFGDPMSNPKGWKMKKLEDECLDIVDGDHAAPPKSEEGIPFITISNVDKKHNVIDFSKSFFVPQSYYDGLKDNRKPRKGDVLYTVTGSYGYTILIQNNKQFCFQRHIGLLRPKSSLNSLFLAHWGRTNAIKSVADAVATGVAQKTVSLSSLRKFPLILPPFALQQQFAERVKAIEKQKELIRLQLKDTETLMADRMQYYFS